MSDDRTEREDQAILLALEMSPVAPPVEDGDEAMATLVRLYTETLGTLPRALDPMAPSPGLRGRLLMAAAGDETQEVKSPMLRGLAPRQPGTPGAPRTTGALDATQSRAAGGPGRPAGRLPATPSRPIAAEASPRSRQGLPPTAPIGVRAPSRWPLRIAATLAVGLLGLSGWLGWQMEVQAEELARLRSAARQAAGRDAELTRLREAMKGMESNVALVSSPSVLVCPLRPAVGAAAAPLGARAVLYVAADHQHWYFTARGLKESPAGQEYQIWFVANGRPISGGTFSMKPGEAAHMSSATMPADTTAVSITLERKGGAVLPSGPQVLFGDQMQQVS